MTRLTAKLEELDDQFYTPSPGEVSALISAVRVLAGALEKIEEAGTVEYSGEPAYNLQAMFAREGMREASRLLCGKGEG